MDKILLFYILFTLYIKLCNKWNTKSDKNEGWKVTFLNVSKNYTKHSSFFYKSKFVEN